MQQIVLFAFCLVIGILLRWSGRFPPTAGKTMGLWVIYIALPAAALQSVHEVSFASRPDWWLAIATPWIGALLAIVLIWPLCAALGWSRQRCGVLLLAGGWGNTSFVGLPTLAALAGREWIGLGVGINLFGSYLSLSTLGIAIATISSSRSFNWGLILKRTLSFPPFIAILAALATNHFTQPQWMSQSLDALSNTLAPVALASVGFSLRFDRLPQWVAPLSVGIIYRLFVAPLVILIIYVVVGEGADPAAHVAILEMAMPPMLAASIVATDHDLEPDLVALLNAVGILLALPIAGGWWSAAGAL